MVGQWARSAKSWRGIRQVLGVEAQPSQHRYRRLERQMAVEVGAAEADAEIGEDVVLAVGRRGVPGRGG